MKAMTWLKIGGGLLVALAAIAAADTRRIEVTEQAPEKGGGHVIASRLEQCRIIGEANAATKSGCCQKKEVENADVSKHSGCCRK